MQSIDKLRMAATLLQTTDMHPTLGEIADEIEAEITDRYMELPMDADGVPVHPGDPVELNDGYEGEVWLVGVRAVSMCDHTILHGKDCRHVKPRTIEDVLEQLVAEFADDTDAATINRYADEIRGMM